MEPFGYGLGYNMVTNLAESGQHTNMSGPQRLLHRWINNDDAFLQALAADIAGQSDSEVLTSEDQDALRHYGEQVNQYAIHKASRKTGSANFSEDPKEANAISSIFRGRRLLYETSLYTALYPDTMHEANLSLVALYTVEQQLNKLESSERLERLAEETTVTGRRDNEDDYDEESDDDADIDDDAETVERQVKEEDDIHSQIPKSEDVVLRNGSHEATDPRDTRDDDALLLFDLTSMFHTLEYDRHAMIEQNTLEASDRQVEHDIQHTENQRLSNVNFGAANLSLKHLIAKIDESREKLQMSDNELRALLSEVRKNRSKWANEEKVGQEELYEAAERVVLELRGYTEHSTAFLNKVTKRDVPDYYNVIKNPMDLGTLMKNLKNLVYKSKAEFEHDVMLIWQNCLTYNAVETHPLRRHAFAMRRKSEQLLAMVPDVVIRDRADVEAEEFGVAEQDDDDEEEEDKNKVYTGKSTRGTFGSKSTKSKKANHNLLNGEQEHGSGVNTPIKKEAPDNDILPSPAIVLEAQKTLPASGDPDARNGAPQVVNDVEQIENNDTSFQIWRTRTKKSRAIYASRRHRRIKQDMIATDEPFQAPTAESLLRSRTTLDPTDQHNDNDAEDEIVIQEYEICNMPECGAGIPLETHSSRTYGVSETISFEPPIGGLCDKMKATALEMKNIRQLCTKLSTLKLMQDPTMNAFPASYFRQLMDAEAPLRYDPFFLEQADLDNEPCGAGLSQALLTRSTAQILYHAGFEDFTNPALTAFTEVAGEFIKTLGKLMVQFTESRDHLEPEEIVNHTLFEVGVDNYSALEDYILDEVYGRHEKITQLHGRLKKFLNDFIHGTANINGEPNGTNLFDEGNQDAFVSGNFGDETGEDFFGFRELGLDKEFGMSSLSVPLRLLQGRLRPMSAGTTTLDGEVSGPRFDRKFPHITKDVADCQIGLIRPFLYARLELLDEEDQGILVEDEELPIRQRKPKPRLGPTGKITSAMKRPLRDPYNSPSKKRKKAQESDRKDQDAASPTASISYELQPNGTSL